MKIYELKKGTPITIRCKQKDMMFDIDTRVADIRGEIVLLPLIRHEGKVIDFSSPNVELIVIFEDGLAMPKAWTNCKIQRGVIEGRSYHMLATSRPSVRINRRHVTRVRLELPGTLRVPSNPDDIEITVYDISGNGIGFKSRTKIDEQDYAHLQIEYTDPGQDDKEIKVEAKVAWKKESEDGELYYGCRLTHAEESFGYYLAAKVREMKEQ